MSGHDHLTFAFFHLTMLWWCLFFCIWHWRGGVIVWIWIIATFNLPSMRWWWWRTMNINYWCPWRSHNLKLNEKKNEESNEHYFFSSLSLFLFSYDQISLLLLSHSLVLCRSYIHCVYMYICVCASSVIKERQMNIDIFTSRLCSRNTMKSKKKLDSFCFS